MWTDTLRNSAHHATSFKSIGAKSRGTWRHSEHQGHSSAFALSRQQSRASKAPSRKVTMDGRSPLQDELMEKLSSMLRSNDWHVSCWRSGAEGRTVRAARCAGVAVYRLAVVSLPRADRDEHSAHARS